MMVPYRTAVGRAALFLERPAAQEGSEDAVEAALQVVQPPLPPHRRVLLAPQALEHDPLHRLPEMAVVAVRWRLVAAVAVVAVVTALTAAAVVATAAALVAVPMAGWWEVVVKMVATTDRSNQRTFRRRSARAS